MSKHLLTLSTSATIILALGVAWSSAMPTAILPSDLIGGFCTNNTACASQFQANCTGANCPAGTTHEECQANLENNNKTCTVNGNCKNTAGCDDHGDCTCS